MELLSNLHELKSYRDQLSNQNASLALVPTMGALHKGHLSLVQLAKQHANRVMVSIFVNPMQFGPNEDFSVYPRTLDADLKLLNTIGCNAVFAPLVEEMVTHTHHTRIVVPEITATLCGASRPGHFDGVTTIVAKLFHLVEPHFAIFGEKDFQQYKVIERMVQDLNWPITLLPAPIVRESDGLAFSSRNRFLSSDDRVKAPYLRQTLYDLSQVLSSKMNHVPDIEICLTQAMTKLTHLGFRVDYLELRHKDTLGTINTLTKDLDLILLVAAFLGGTRLIDNWSFKVKS